LNSGRSINGVLKDVFEVFEPDLKDTAYAAELLRISLEEEAFDVFLVNLRDIVRARGMISVARVAGLAPERLLELLSPAHSPEFETICAILKALNLRVHIDPIVKRAA
jgi:probable addiction module antidote protein